MAICANCVRSIGVGRIACSTHSILGERRSCCLGGDKTGNARWYEIHVPKADAIYDQYLVELQKEGLL